MAFVRLLADEGVLTVPGSGFGAPGHIRISLTVERETVIRALPGFERVSGRREASGARRRAASPPPTRIRARRRR